MRRNCPKNERGEKQAIHRPPPLLRVRRQLLQLQRARQSRSLLLQIPTRRNQRTMGRNQLDLRQNVLTVNNIISKFVLALQMMLNINQYCINDKSLIFYACPSVCCGFLRKNNKEWIFSFLRTSYHLR